MTPEITLKEHLADGGLLGSWEYRGNTQPPVTVQLTEFDEDLLDGSDRCLLIRNQGAGGGNYLVREPIYQMAVISKKGGNDNGAARHYAELIKDYISQNFTAGCIMSININGDTAGPYQLESGRRYYELPMTLINDTGEA